VPNAGAQPFGYFLAFEKVTRCKSGTASRHTRSNGYSPNQPKHGRLPGHHDKQKKSPSKRGAP
ncbi:hypothetical protein, partial [Pseudomonas bananamidigenes]|uniref:hypothetical protein n=1 Tax=Pseudomonas bananamidigenes TaxID=2843610 RepID=UPI001C3FFCD6